jgi:hypothetical protein
MSQLQVSVQLTNGSASVVVPNEDLRPNVHAGYLLSVEDETGLYTLSAEPSFTSPDTTLSLTAPYGGTTGTKNAVLVCDFTAPDSIPLINPGDVHTASIFTEAMKRVQTILSALNPAFVLLKANNLSDLTDVAAARANLVLGNVENKSSATIRSEITSANVTTALGYTPWHAGNDGAGSGLDADLLDGQHGAFYQNAGNLNAGTAPAARLGTGTPGATTVLWGDSTWRALAAGDITAALTYTPLNRAADTMQGDLGFATTKKIVQVNEYGVKWQLAGAADYIELNAANTSWDFNRASGTVDKWRFVDGASVRFQIDAAGILINGSRLAASASGLLELGNDATDQEFRIHNASGTDWEALRLRATDTGAFVQTGQGGAGVARPLTVGTAGNADLLLMRNGSTRWTVHDTSITPAGAYDIGSSGNPVQDIYASRRFYAPTLTAVNAPPFAGVDDTDTGMRFPAADTVELVTGGVARLTIDSAKINTNALQIWLGSAVKIGAEGTGVVSLKDAANAQTILHYHDDDGAGNYVRGSHGWSSGKLLIAAQAGGTGVVPNMKLDAAALELATAGTSRLIVGTSGLTTTSGYTLGAAATPFGTLFNTSLQQYHSYTDPSNYEWAGAEWSGTEWILGSRKAGTGQYRSVVVRTGASSNVARVRFSVSNAVGSVHLEADDGTIHGQLYSDSSTAVKLETLQSKALQIISAANKVAFKNGVNAQTFEIYNTDDGAGNLERGEFRWAGNALIFGTQKAGSGVSRDLQFQTGGALAWQILAGTRALTPTAPNTMDLGSSTNTIKDIYLDGSIVIAGVPLTAGGSNPGSLLTLYSLFGGL